MVKTSIQWTYRSTKVYNKYYITCKLLEFVQAGLGKDHS